MTERIVWQSKIITLPVEHTQQVTFEDSSHLETSLAISDARIMADGRLFHSLKNKTNFLQDSIPSLEKETVVTKDSIITVEKIVKVEVEQELSKWQKILISLGYIGIGFIIVFRLQNSPKVRVTFGLVFIYRLNLALDHYPFSF